MIRYPEYRKNHCQIGSILTDAQCEAITYRVKGHGRRWNPDNAEAIMALAALHNSNL